MATQLIESLAAEFEPDKFHDTYREEVLELIERKASGEEIVRRRRPRPSPTRSSTSWPPSRRRWPRPRRPARATRRPGPPIGDAAPRRGRGRRGRGRRGAPSRSGFASGRPSPPIARLGRQSARNRHLDGPNGGPRRVGAWPPPAPSSRSTGASCRSPTSTRCCTPRPGSPRRGHRLLRAGRADDAHPPRRPRRHLQALPQRRRRQVLLREALPVAPARLGADGHRPGRRRPAVGERRSAAGGRAAAGIRPCGATARASTTACSTRRRRWCGPPTWPPSSSTRRWPGRATSRRRRWSCSTSIPGPPADILECAEVALDIRDVLDGARLRAVRQDVGLEGPAAVPAAEHARTPTTTPSSFAQAVAQVLEKHHPTGWSAT